MLLFIRSLRASIQATELCAEKAAELKTTLIHLQWQRKHVEHRRISQVGGGVGGGEKHRFQQQQQRQHQVSLIEGVAWTSLPPPLPHPDPETNVLVDNLSAAVTEVAARESTRDDGGASHPATTRIPSVGGVECKGSDNHIRNNSNNVVASAAGREAGGNNGNALEKITAKMATAEAGVVRGGGGSILCSRRADDSSLDGNLQLKAKGQALGRAVSIVESVLHKMEEQVRHFLR